MWNIEAGRMILHIEPSQLPHARFSDPTEIWENLEQVHCACRFVTRLALRREFLYMKKRDDQVMNSWIAKVKNTVYRLDAAGVAIIDEDIILTLTAGLPDLYSTLIVTLVNLSLNELMLPNVITRLLNEEVQQNAHEDAVELSGPVYSVQDAKNKKIKTPLSEITCYSCGKKGHYKSTCPVLKKESETGDKVVASLF
jgi:gag-polypeptide of LTR copia-type/Zinc knuckle